MSDHERALSPYNCKYASYPFALQNSNALCYLNSLIQSLISCTSFNEYLIKSVKEGYSNGIINEYLKIYNNYSYNSNVNKIEVDNAFSILKELFISRKKAIADYNLSLYNQEDIHEGFVLMLDSIGNNVEQLFHNTYKCEIKCRKCKKITTPGNDPNYKEPPELFIDLSEENPYIQNNLNNKEHIEKYIGRNIQITPNYKCENCGVRNNCDPITGLIEENIIQVYSLTGLSEIIVIMFKKYKSKKNKYFPPILEFKSITGKLKYRLVSQVEHYGNMYGGHYIARCLRMKPSYFHKYRKEKAKMMISNIQKEMEKLSIDSKKNKYEAKIKDIKNSLEIDMIDKDNLEAVLLFNDEKVIYCPEGFKPTPYTYMVFYHLCE